MNKDSIGNRMKENYENRYRLKLTRRMPVIMRLDGKAFHSITKGCEKPFDRSFLASMQLTALKLCTEIQGAKCAYTQSDEISILITDFDKLTTDAWFDYNIQKMVSVSAGIASACFSSFFCHGGKYAVFDSRVFNVPKEEVCNYFVWRQQDWIRNSVQMYAQSVFSYRQLHKKNQADMHEMLHKKGLNWASLDFVWKNGTFISKSDGAWTTGYDIIFTQDRDVIEDYLEPEEE